MSQFAPTSVAPTADSGITVLRAEGQRSKAISYFFFAAAAAGILLRAMVAGIPGDALRTPWGGGGDSATYLLLAQNLTDGKGLTYAGMPTALRAPGYPLILAGMIKLLGAHALVGMRWLQFLEGLGAAVLCARLSRRLFGATAGKFALLVALFSPTLAEMNGEILTEATATLFGVIFIFLLASYVMRPSWLATAGMGLAIGLASLTRFNMAVLGIVALLTVLLKASKVKWAGAATVVFLPLIIISPWMIRNYLVFDDQALFSTHSGLDALEGVLTPQGRALPGDAEKLRGAVGWVPPVDVETNGPSRNSLGAEPALDQQCWNATLKIWREIGWGLIPIEVRKIADFWLSTDQLLSTSSFNSRNRAIRRMGVLVYWVILALAVAGWMRLRLIHPSVARIFLFYAAIVTAMHLPFVMNTRLRLPFIDPLLAALAGAGVLALAARSAPRVMEPTPTYAAE